MRRPSAAFVGRSVLLVACAVLLVALPGGSFSSARSEATLPGAPSHSPSLSGSTLAQTSPHLLSSGAPDWIDVTSRYSSAPSARSFGNLAWDTSANEGILFGGENGAAVDGDTWSFTASAGWKQICSSCSPAARAETEYAYDSTDNVVVMFGGCEGLSPCPASDTWTFSGSTWTQNTKGTTPTGSLAGGASDDPADGDVVMFGGCSDFKIDILDPGASACGTTDYLATTYTFTVAGGWTQVNSASSPSAREAPGMAYDPLTQQVLLYGGWNGATSTTFGDMWAFHAGEWYELHPATTPGPLSNFVMFWDGSLNEMIAFGGDTPSQESDLTFAYANGNWTQLFPAPPLPQPRDGVMGAAPPTGFPVIYGGELNGSNNQADTWVFGPPLTASAAVSPTSTDVGLPVAFSASLSGGQPPYTVSWSFGDNSAAVAVSNTTHAYKFPGSGDVANFSVKDSYGFTAGQSFTVAIAPLPTLLAAASPTSGDTGNVTSFWANATGGTPPLTYSWSFGDGGTSTSASPQHTYTTAANYTATASVVDAVGQGATSSVIVVVKTPPGALVGHASATPATGQVPLSVALAAHVSGGVAPYTYFWSYGDGTRPSYAPDPTHTYNSTGSFLAQLTANDSAGHSATWGVQIQVLPGPLHLTASVNATSGDTPLDVAFSALGTGGIAPYNYTWSFGDGSTSYAADPSHIYADASNLSETFTAEVIVRDSNTPTSSLNRSFTILVAPALLVALLIPPPPAVGATATFFATAAGGTPPYSYFWDFGDGTTASTQGTNSSQHAYQTNQSFRVVVTVTDAAGRSASSFGTVQPGASDAKQTVAGVQLFNEPDVWLYVILPLVFAAILAEAVMLGVGGSASKLRWRAPRSPPPSGKFSEPPYYPGSPWQ